MGTAQILSNNFTSAESKVHSGIDLNVAFIERNPSYSYYNDQKWPDPNEQVTFIAHIANRGTLNSGSFAFEWTIDGQSASIDTHAGLAAGEEDIISISWNWALGNHEVLLTLDPINQINELTETNNSRIKQANAIMWGVWVEHSF